MAPLPPLNDACERRPRTQRRRLRGAVDVLPLLLLLSLLLVGAPHATACPFCTALRPTLAQQREAAAIVALVEAVGEGASRRYRLHRIHAGAEVVGETAELILPADRAVAAGTLAVVFGRRDDGDAPLEWSLVPVDETAYAYFVLAPSLRERPAERLAYFARHLEHSNPLIAEDAYQEFGHADYDDVAAVARGLAAERIREWLVDGGIPQHRKGLYGLVLGMAGDTQQRRASAALLERLISTPASDLRAGFDGMLAGYLLLRGEEALDLIDRRILANPKSADGDVRHAIAALRFYFESGREITKERLCASMRKLLARPEFAPAAVVELARWEDWQSLAGVAELYDRPGYPQPATRRAVVGYLSTAPTADAAARLAEIARRDPAGVEDALVHLRLFGTLRE